ncbi:MAG: hypothetical protein K0B05_02100, partial [Bacteroidales bacterium]|nr:hypothetical protein [Bacteroidales bacterium]
PDELLEINIFFDFRFCYGDQHLSDELREYIRNDLLSGSMRAWKDLTTIRLNHQVNCINEGKEPDNIVDFNVADADMLYFAEKAVSTLNGLMLKAGSDFHTETI